MKFYLVYKVRCYKVHLLLIRNHRNHHIHRDFPSSENNAHFFCKKEVCKIWYGNSEPSLSPSGHTQSRRLCLDPSPQETEHSDHGTQSPTEHSKIYILRKVWAFSNNKPDSFPHEMKKNEIKDEQLFCSKVSFFPSYDLKNITEFGLKKRLNKLWLLVMRTARVKVSKFCKFVLCSLHG